MNYVEESRLVMSWVDILDIAFIAFFFSIALVWLKRRTSRSILFALVPLIITFAVAKSLKMYLTSQVFQLGLMALSASVVVIFQEDFRRAFDTLASWRPWGRGDILAAGKVNDILVECLVGFSKTKTGALIVLQGRQSIESHVRQGISLRGQLSLPLLQSIFDHHSPGHDGGATIIEGKLDKFGAHLPLSRNSAETGRLGTRHAAALGLSEKCDALILIVSEETGTVSVAQDGKLEPARSATAIRDAIRDHYRKLGPLPLHRTLFEIPWGRLATSVVLAGALWLVFARPANLIQRMVEVPIVYQSLPKGWEAKPPVPLKVKLTLFGPEGPLMRLDSTGLSATVDLTRASEGQQRFVLSETNVNLPARVRLKYVEPQEVMIHAYPTLDTAVPVQVVWHQTPGTRGPSSGQVRVAPARVTLRIPRGAAAPKFLETEPVDLRDLRRTGKAQVKLRVPADMQMAEMAAPEVEVTLIGAAPGH